LLAVGEEGWAHLVTIMNGEGVVGSVVALQTSMGAALLGDAPANAIESSENLPGFDG
jgi:hypothetical protein